MKIQYMAGFGAKMRWETRGNVAMGIFGAVAGRASTDLRKTRFGLEVGVSACCMQSAKATGPIYRHYVICEQCTGPPAGQFPYPCSVIS